MSEREPEQPLDPGAYIGHEPELASERIPGGVQPEDERVAFNSSQRAVDGEADEAAVDPPERREAGQNR
jgi:hypothetical protein